jgi:hypothetical protein
MALFGLAVDGFSALSSGALEVWKRQSRSLTPIKKIPLDKAAHHFNTLSLTGACASSEGVEYSIFSFHYAGRITERSIKSNAFRGGEGPKRLRKEFSRFSAITEKVR